MSIHDVIKDRLGAQLFAVNPRASWATVQRPMVVTAEVQRFLIGPWASQDEENRASRLKADLDRFVEGMPLEQDFLKRLIPRRDEVWEIKSVEPEPQIRVLGRFVETDYFLATHYELRDDLGNFRSPQWLRTIRRCLAIWRVVVPAHGPHTGAEFHDYVTNAADPKYFR